MVSGEALLMYQAGGNSAARQSVIALPLVVANDAIRY